MACKDCRAHPDTICATAAYNGHLQCLIWARRNGYRWTEYTCTWAAGYGHIDCLIWAQRNGCPWSIVTCIYAAQNGHLDCLIWARKNGCPWDEMACFWAKYKGHKDILKWIHKNGSPCNCTENVVYEVWYGWHKGEECNICFEELDESTVKFVKCRHHYHKECMFMMLEEMTKKHCSICERT